jgi:hypothetical protein
MAVIDKAAGDGVELHSLLIVKPQCRGEPSSSIAMDDRAEASLDVTDGAGADARTIRELLLGQPGRRPEPLQQNAQRRTGHRSTIHHPF